VIEESQQLVFQSIVYSQLKDAQLEEAGRDSLIVGAGGAFTAIALYLESIGEAPASRTIACFTN
jgi:shikimate 5-dehydrogenase